MRRIRLVICLAWLGVIIVPTALFSMPPPLAYQGKKIEELLPLFDSPSAETRKNATAGISWHLEQNQITLTNIKSAVIEATVLKTSSLFKREDNRTVRLGCIAVLLNLNAWTNTIQALTQTTGDKDYLVRVRAITALQYVSQNHHEQLPAHVISLLEECLNNSSDNEILWQAAFIAGESRSQKFLPLLQNLLNNPSSKVQKYAVEAINKIKH